jgi:hypothetical protein
MVQQPRRQPSSFYYLFPFCSTNCWCKAVIINHVPAGTRVPVEVFSSVCRNFHISSWRRGILVNAYTLQFPIFGIGLKNIKKMVMWYINGSLIIKCSFFKRVFCFCGKSIWCPFWIKISS